MLGCCLSLWAQTKEKSYELKKMTIEEYIRTYAPVAKREMRQYGIPASITLAQSILESNFGNSPLAREANNHFGIKCHTGWQGKGYYMNDDAVNECFRIYDSPEESFRDHSEFLRSRPRYADLFKLDPKDYKGWARGLQAAGYATNPQYANLLIRIIEERNLHQYDTADPELAAKLETKEDVIKVFENKILIFNGLKVVVAQPKQTITEIGTQFGIDYKKLKKYNDILNDDDTNYYLIPGSKVYLQPKKTKGFSVTHRVQENETMHAIAQKEGIRLENLFKLNLMKPGQEPAIGETLQLRKKAQKPPRLKTDAEIERLYSKIRRLTTKEKPQDEIKETMPGMGPSINETKPETAVQKEPEKKSDDKSNKNEPSARNTTNEKVVTESSPSISQPIYHIVEPQQTLYSISLMYNVRIEDIQQWNNLKSNKINTGQQLIVGYTTDKIKTADDLRVKKPNMTPVYHTVKPRETLMSIAAWYDVKTDDLKRWNQLSSYNLQPGTQLIVGYVKAGDSPPKSSPETTEYSEQPAPAVRETTVTELPKKETTQPARIENKKIPKYHFVETGETLFAISKKHNVTVEQLMEWNNLKSPAISSGQRLIVGYITDAATSTQDLPKQQAVSSKEAPAQEALPNQTQNEKEIYHVVRPGETLFAISKKYNVSVEKLSEWNNLKGASISVGQKLIVAQPKQLPKTDTSAGSEKYHTVEPGETAFSISKKYGITVEQIKQWNNLPDYNLKAGQRIIVGK
jgi:LysM repeat protein